MAAIPTILKGDDSGAITLNIASGRTYTGATLVVAYQGVTRSFTNLTAGGTVSLSFTHDETAKMTPGCKPVLMRLVGSTGSEETVENADARIKVTECLAEVNAGGSFAVAPGTQDSSGAVPVTDLGDVGENYTIAQLQAKINQIVRTLAQRSLLAIAPLALAALLVWPTGHCDGGVESQTARLDALANDALVVTNVSGAATDPGTVCELITNNVASWAMAGQAMPSGGGTGGVSEQTVTGIVASAAVTNAGAFAAAQAMTNAKLTTTNGYGSSFDWDEAKLTFKSGSTEVSYLDATGIHTTGIWLNNTDVDAVLTQVDFINGNYAPKSTVSALVTTTATHTASIASHASQLGQLSQSNTQLATSVSAISAHLNAEDAHFVSTNYDSTVRTPEAYVEVKVDGTWLTIWREMTRWTDFVGSAFDWDTWTGFHTWGTNVTANISDLWATKADRCWGAYDSETGNYSPEGVTQISSSNILIAANMAYQRTVTTDGAVWVLQCNNGHATLGGDTNGYFRIYDGTGTCQFEIIQGNQQELGADAGAVTNDTSTSPNTLRIYYSVVAGEHPTLKICNGLVSANWKSETDADCLANVTWTGTSGAYVAAVQPKTAQSKLFVTATYSAEGETYINNRAPVGMSSIYLNGTKYYLGTATIDGHTVLTLSTTAP